MKVERSISAGQRKNSQRRQERSKCQLHDAHHRSRDSPSERTNSKRRPEDSLTKRKASIEELDPAGFDVPPRLQEPWTRLFNYCEELHAEIQKLREENQRLRDELAKYKKRAAKPKLDANKDKKDKDKKGKGKGGSSSSGRDRNKEPKDQQEEPVPRNQRIKIDRERIIRLSDEERPADFVSIGFRDVIQQNVRIQTDNTKFRLERGYSESTGKFYEASLPDGVQPGYGPELQALVLDHYFELRVTQPKIHKLLTDHDIVISSGQISNLLTKNHAEWLAEERADVLWAGLCATTFQQIDDTGMRVDGVNQYVTTLCSPYYSCFFIRRHKNADTIQNLIGDELERPDFTLDDYVFILLGDDAKQFHNQTQYRALCWIHEGRLFKKLRPLFTAHQKHLDDFLGDFWDYYDELKEYKEHPTKKARKRLEKKFDELFGRTTGYDELDHRIALTRAKKEQLLLVLQFPEAPLDNNESERSLREWVIKRHISRGVRSQAGARAWESNFTLCDTARKVGQSYYHYLVDRISGKNELPSLAERIFELSGVPNPDLDDGG